MALVLDTSGLYAILEESEPAHQQCMAVLSGYSEFIVPAMTLAELDYWCRKRSGGPEAFAAFVGELRDGVYQVEHLTLDDFARAAQLEVMYADLDLGLVDASIIATCERLGETDLLTLDRRDFSVVRPRHCDALRLLPD
jgi:hypothetical protein